MWQRLLVLSSFLGLVVLFFLDIWDDAEAYEFTGSAMGTFYTVKLDGLVSDVDVSILEADIRSRIELVDKLMSTYKPDSELMQINSRPASTDWFNISPELADVIQVAKKVYDETHGAFDPTLKPVVDLWGFGSEIVDEEAPDQLEINERLALKDFGAVFIKRSEDGLAYLRKTKPVTLDLSAIAPGYAVDKVAKYLAQQGIVNYLVDVSGELKISGTKSDGSAWRVAIESPIVNRHSVFRVLESDNLGIATSGDYRNYRQINGQQYGHIIDPSSGWPVRHDTASVTVVDTSVARADALATALFVMNKENAIRWADQHGQAVFCIYRTKSGFASVESKMFTRLFGDGAKVDGAFAYNLRPSIGILKSFPVIKSVIQEIAHFPLRGSTKQDLAFHSEVNTEQRAL